MNEKTFGQSVADAIERYYEARSVAADSHMPLKVAERIVADAKTSLGKDVDSAIQKHCGNIVIETKENDGTTTTKTC